MIQCWVGGSYALSDESIERPQAAARVEICSYLGGKQAAVTASIDSLLMHEVSAPGEWWTDQPGSYFQRLLSFKAAHPQFKTTITFVPRNRSNNPGVDPSILDVRNAPSWVRDWVVHVQRDFDWIEIADHGLTHAPDEAGNLDEHEFNPLYNPDALDPGWCDQRFAEIRMIFSEVGLDNSLIRGFRGPGFQWTDPVMDALVKENFTYVLVKGFEHHLLRPVVRKVAADKSFEEAFRIHPFYYRTEAGNRILFLPTTAHPTDPDFEELYTYIIKKHGIINFFYHFQERVYTEFDTRLRYLEGYDDDPSDGLNGDQLWWATTGELADYFIKAHSMTIDGILEGQDQWIVDVRSNSSLTCPTSLLIRVPPSFISSVTVDGKELGMEATKEGTVVTSIFSNGVSRISVKFSEKPEVLLPSGDEAEADRIYQSWMEDARSTQTTNGISIVALALSGILGVVAAELICLRVHLRSKGKLRLGLPLLALVGAVGWIAVRFGIVTTRVTATGFGFVDKYLLYLGNLVVNQAAVIEFPIFDALVLLFSLFFIDAALNMVLVRRGGGASRSIKLGGHQPALELDQSIVASPALRDIGYIPRDIQGRQRRQYEPGICRGSIGHR